MFFAVASSAWGAAELRVGNAYVQPGGTTLVPVRLTGETNIVIAQFELVFTNLSAYSSNAQGGPVLADHRVASNESPAGRRRALVYSPTNAALGQGLLVTIPFSVSNTMPSGVTPLTLTNIVLADYDARPVTNFTLVAGSLTTTSSVPVPATILSEPADQVVAVGLPATLSVTATGTPPLSYQWQLNGTPIAGATEATLAFPSAAQTNGGSYRVAVSNAFDAVVSRSATFLVIKPLVVSVQGRGTVTRFPDQAFYNLGQAVSLTASAARWAAFQGWSDGSTANPRSITIAVSNHYTAIFTNTIALETLTIGGATRTAPVGTPVVLLNGQFYSNNVVPTTNGDQFQVSLQTSFADGTLLYTVDGSDPEVGDIYVGPFTVTAPFSIRAVAYSGDFSHSAPSDAVNSLSLITPGGGVLSFAANVDLFTGASTATITAAPNSGWSLLNWSGHASGTNLTFVLPMDGPKSVRADFGTSLGTGVVGSGSILKSPAQSLYAYGSTVRLSAVPNPGNYFRFWGGPAIGLSNSPISIIVTNAGQTVSGFFAPLPANSFALTVLISGQGNVTKTPQLANYTNGQSVTLTATPLGGELFLGWSGAASGTNNPLTVTMNTNLTITGNFASNAPPGPPVFSLSSSTYSVAENGGAVTVTVLKSFNSLAGTVNYATADGTAVAFSGGFGDYQAVAGSLSFTNGETSQTVTIPLIDDQYYEGNQSFGFLLSASGGGGSLGSPATATITILDDDPASTTNSFLESVFPAVVPPHDGQLRVTIEPAIAGGQWRQVWETAWRNSGDTLGGLPTGNYVVEFRPVAGFIQPDNTTNPVVAGTLNSVTNVYVASGTPQFGSLTVTLLPTAVASAPDLASRGQWRLQGETNWHDTGVVLAGLIAGHQIVEFKSLANWVTPAPRLVEVGANQINSIGATYLVASASGGTPPSVLQFGDATSPAFGLPFVYNGQLLSEIGYGSGCVVKRRVVLAATHVVFNDATLSYVSGVNWFFQRYAGQYDPAAQTPRGWYAFTGYAAARTNDNSPGVASPASQNLDVAALYFLEDAGRGGSSGYLVSDPGATEWLQASALKTLVGYPMQVVSDFNRGRMFATTPGNLSFTPVTNRVFSTTAILGYPGMSGGPLCVQFTNGNYYPAGIYLGGSGETIVRAIDGAVADLINRADLTAHTGDNSTGGGVIRIVSSGVGGRVGYLEVRIGPTNALLAGGGWRMAGSANGYENNPNLTTTFNAQTNFTIEFAEAIGWESPPSRSVTVTLGQLTVIDASYLVSPPAMAFIPGLGLGLYGTSNTTYRLEYRTNLVSGTWLPLRTNTLGAGFNLVLPWPPTNGPAAFYRAVWLP